MRAEKSKGTQTIEKGVQLILQGLHEEFGLDTSDENFTETPQRVARAYLEMCNGINCKEEIVKSLNKMFPSDYDGMIVGKDIRCFSLCPHHLLPVEYNVTLGYIPENKVLGLSKLSRIVVALAKAPKLQEDFTKDVIEILKKLNCKGAIVQVKGRHLCMCSRGIKQFDSWSYTSEIYGNFKQPETRNEFQLLVQK